MKFQNILGLISISSLVLAVPVPDNEESNQSVDFCKVSEHTGKSIKEDDIKVGSIGDIGYEIWYQGGENSATFYEDGSFTCSFKKSKDYLCRSGLSFDSTQTHEEIGHLYADFKLVKKDTEDVDYSYVGIYGWSREPLVEYYVVDNWLSENRPGDWVGEKKHGDFMIDGAEYTVYENTRYNAPSIDGDTTFTQFFSVRKEARDCGTIDITAHFKKWEELGMKLGKLHEAKVLGEAGSIHDGTSGTADFPYAKVYIKKDESEPTPSDTTPIEPTLTPSEPVESADFCKVSEHTGKSIKEDDIKVGSIGDIGYEIWYQGGENSATFYEDGSFTCSFKKSKDYLCRSGLSFDSTQTHEEIGHLYADFKLVKKDTEDVDYSYVGIYGWSREPLVEYYVVDNWLSENRPGDWVGEKKHGDFMIDGAEYTVYENTRYNAPSIDGDTTFTQFFSVRKEARDCGTIDITAHFKKWEELGMKLGKLHEAKVLGEAGSIHDGTSGTADFPYAKVYIKKDESEQEQEQDEPIDEPIDIDSEVEQSTDNVDSEAEDETEAESTDNITEEIASTNTKRKCIVRKHKN